VVLPVALAERLFAAYYGSRGVPDVPEEVAVDMPLPEGYTGVKEPTFDEDVLNEAFRGRNGPYLKRGIVSESTTETAEGSEDPGAGDPESD
jgi:hypothetical protein